MDLFFIETMTTMDCLIDECFLLSNQKVKMDAAK
tara:strand:+ start:2476 stop:2577 length:102 start_codon:yes stop_codon:yes gene_type:complete